MKSLLRFSILFLILVLGCRAEAREKSEPPSKKMLHVGNVAVLGIYSKIRDGSDLTGVYASANYAPVIKLSSRDCLIPLYIGLYKKQRQIVTEEEGGRLYTTVMSHNLSFMHKHVYPDNLLTQRVTGFCSFNYNKETADEAFGAGLYDYRDYGLSVDYQHDLTGTEADDTLLFGGKYYFREYPNFRTLISLAAQTAPEKNEKNQHVWGLTSRYTRKFPDELKLVLSYDFLFKYFTDKHTIDSNGILGDNKREDNVQFFRLKWDYQMRENLGLGLAGEVELNNSSQDYYDTMDTALVLGDDVFVHDYFDYNRCELRPSLTYVFPLKNKKVTLQLAYAYTIRDYSSRDVKDSLGAYKSEEQKDRIHAGFLNLNYPLTPKLSFLINADYIHNISNMEYEKYYRYDYDIYHFLAGFSYNF